MKTVFLKKIRKVTSGTLVLALLFPMLSPLGDLAFASVNPTGNTISGGNNNYVNLSNSGSYPITLGFSGVLSAGDIIHLDVMSGSTPIQSYT
jgi:hypothetical protein